MSIIKVIIKGSSGYGPVDEAYEDKVTITTNSISYEYKPDPMSQLETNIARKWSYKTNSPLFEHTFKLIADMTPMYLNSDEILMVTDVGPVTITAIFEDKHRETATFFCPTEFFAEFFRVVKRMVPQTEYIPATLLTEEDYEDECL